MPTLGRITVYPIKSLDGLSVDKSGVLASGALTWDRRFAIVDTQGQMVNGKRTADVHSIRAEFDLTRRNIRLRDARRASSSTAEFSLTSDAVAIGRWLTEALGHECRLIECDRQGFPDDSEALGPTVISTASLEAVASWFDGLSLDEARRRFRANLEIDAPIPFWEDHLVERTAHHPVRFRVGTVEWFGRNPCQRCAVPPRSSVSGEVFPGFAREFSRRRAATLPDFAPRSQFDHFYRLAVNTSLARLSDSAEIAVGEAVEIAG